MFKLIHLSDLHFSQGAHQDSEYHSHSTPHLKALQNIIEKQDFDRLIISGDISDSGNREALLRAYSWIFSTLEIGGGEKTGLKLMPEKVGLVPGNHDAWNASNVGTFLQKRQVSLNNYNSVFINHKVSDVGCSYDWIEDEEDGIYIAYADTSLLGEHIDTVKKVPGASFLEEIAKGKFSVSQSECLLEWHDKGLLGKLLYPCADKYIDKKKYARSLKIIVMHHYIFEPYNEKSKQLLMLKEKNKVFRNIALSDFDVLLCGHRHYLSLNKHTYGEHFDRRAIERYTMNCFRRNIGTYSLPLQYQDEHGNMINKKLSEIINILIRGIKSSRNPASDDYLDELINALKLGLEKPSSFKSKVFNYLSKQANSGGKEFSSAEIKSIQKHISINFNIRERKILSGQASDILTIAKTLKNRVFLQSMCGSSAKATKEPKERNLSVYSIEFKENAWHVLSESFLWDWGKNNFQVTPNTTNEIFIRNATRVITKS